ncbi:MAG: hypothetical protein OXJ52_01280 [Oligoflexia bacterium]|nr:hypothetical protein [Oligoflexia bacterium]
MQIKQLKLFEGLNEKETQLVLFKYKEKKIDGTILFFINLFFGGLGINYFYRKNIILGVFCICICWSGLPFLYALFNSPFQWSIAERHNRHLLDRLIREAQVLKPDVKQIA